MLHFGHRNTRRGLQAPFRQRDIHRRGHISLIFELHRERFERRVKRHAFDFFTWNGPTTQLQLHKLIARVPIIARNGERIGITASALHRHGRQAIISLELPGSAAATAKRPNTKGNHQHGKHRKTNRDKAMVRAALLCRYIPLRLSI